MVAFTLHRCACSAESLVVHGETTLDVVATALDVAARLRAELVIAADGEVACSACNARYETADDPVLRVLDRVASASAEPAAVALN